MPDENDAEGTVFDDSQGGERGEDTPGGATTDKPYVGTYKTREDAEKGFVEKEQTIRRLRSELDKAKNHAELLQSVTDAVKAGNSAPKPTPGDEDRNKRLQELAAKIDEEGGKATVEVLREFGSELEEHYKSALKSERGELQKAIDAIHARLADVDPEFVSVKDKVAELASDLGLDAKADRAVLMKLAKRELAKAGPRQPNRPPAPGTTGTVTGSPHGLDGLVTAEDRERAKSIPGYGGEMTEKEAQELARMTDARRRR